MPIASGAIGRVNVLLAPSKRDYGPGGAKGTPIGRSGTGRVGGVNRAFRSPPFSTLSVRITGITKNSTGAALGGCTVDLFRTLDDLFLGTTTSDGSGNYSLVAPIGGPFYVVAYLAGAPDVAGTTVNTLQPA